MGAFSRWKILPFSALLLPLQPMLFRSCGRFVRRMGRHAHTVEELDTSVFQAHDAACVMVSVCRQSGVLRAKGGAKLVANLPLQERIAGRVANLRVQAVRGRCQPNATTPLVGGHHGANDHLSSMDTSWS